MNEQNSGERFIPWGRVERIENDTNSPVANSDLVTDEVPVDATLLHAAPIGGAVANVGPMGEPIVHEAPMAATMPYEAPMGETLIDEAPMAATMPYEAPMGEPVPDESGVSKSMPYIAPMGETITHEASVEGNTGSSAALVNREESEHFRTRWNEIQGKFLDEPRSAVQQADALVSEVVEQITQMFATEHGSLESQWNQGTDVSTEDLRKALQHYRSFFNRLVV